MSGFAGKCDIPTLIVSGDHYPNAEIPDKVARVYSRFLDSHQLD